MGVETVTIETLTAEVRTLMVGSRQVTLSVAKQLDVAHWRDLVPMGRVRLNDGSFAIGRRYGDGVLALANPPSWVMHGTQSGLDIEIYLAPKFRVFWCINHGSAAWTSGPGDTVGDGRVIGIRWHMGPGATHTSHTRVARVYGPGLSFGECGDRCPGTPDGWVPRGVVPEDEESRALLRRCLQGAYEDLAWARRYYDKLPLIVLAGLR